MKFAFAAIVATVVASTSFATSIKRYRGVIEKDVVLTNAQIAPQHMTETTEGKFIINYDNRTVSMRLVSWKMPRCPKNMMCAAVMPAPRVFEVTLPITNIEVGTCDILTVQASKDRRPLDGLYEEIKIEDGSQLPSPCRWVRAPDFRATYLTSSWMNRPPVISKMYVVGANKRRH